MENSETKRLTPEQLEHFNNLLEFTPPHQLRNYLIEMFHSYICHEHESLPTDFRHMAMSVSWMIEILGQKESE